MKNVKFRGKRRIPWQNSAAWFCSKNPYSAAQLEISRPAENCGPCWFLERASAVMQSITLYLPHVELVCLDEFIEDNTTGLKSTHNRRRMNVDLLFTHHLHKKTIMSRLQHCKIICNSRHANGYNYKAMLKTSNWPTDRIFYDQLTDLSTHSIRMVSCTWVTISHYIDTSNVQIRPLRPMI